MVPMTLVSIVWLCFSCGIIPILVVYFTGLLAPFGTDIASLQVDIEAQTDVRLHIKITDPNNKRWEIPAK